MIAAVAERLAIVQKCFDGMEHGFKYIEDIEDALPTAHIEFLKNYYSGAQADDMYNGQRKVVEITADTEGFEEIFKLLQSVLKRSLPHYYPGEILPKVILIQLIKSRKGAKQQIPHMDTVVPIPVVGYLLEGTDLTSICPVDYTDISNPSDDLLSQQGCTREGWLKILYQSYKEYNELSSDDTWNFCSNSIEEQRIFRAMLTDMGICVESANGSGIEFLSEKELSKTHNLCKNQGTSKAGDGIIFWGNVLHYGPESKQDRLFLYAAFGTDKADSTLCKLESATQPIYYDTLLQKHEISDKKLTEERDYAKSELKKVLSLAEDDENIHCVRGVKKDGAFGLFRAIQDSFVAMLQYYYSKKPSSDVFQDSKIKELMVAVCVDRENGHLKLKDMTCTWLEKYLLGGMPSNSNFDDVRESELASEDLIFSNDITKRCFKDNALTLEVKAKLIQDIQQRGYTANYNSGLLILMVTQKVLSQFATLHITTFDRTKPPILRTTNIDCLKNGDTGRARNEGAYKLRLLYYRLLGHYDIFFSHHKQDQRAANLNAAYYEAFLLQLCTLRSGRFVVKKSLTESFGVSLDVGRGLYAAWPIVKGDVIGWFPQSDTDESSGNEGNYRYSNDKLEYDNYKQSCLMSQDVDSGTLCCKPLETEAETMGLAPFINYSKSPNCKALSMESHVSSRCRQERYIGKCTGCLRNKIHSGRMRSSDGR